MKNKIQVVQSVMPPFEEFCNEIKDLWDSKWLTHSGPKHQQLEQSLADYLNVKEVSLFSNGHMALELAIKALGLTGEVITTPYTFASTTQAIVNCGLTPVFCDINSDDYTIDVNKIEQLITEKTSAIIPVHVYGNICDVEKIEEIAKKHNLKVIYDAAHSFGIKYKEKGIASFGDMSMFSFHATKVYHTVEGGCVAYGDSKYKDLFAELRQFGMRGKEEVPVVGTNAKMTEMHAAMGICNLRHIEDTILKRRKVVERYRNRLGNKEGILICGDQKNVQNNYAYFPVVFDGYKLSRDEVLENLAKENIFARKYFYPITSEFEAYQNKFEIQKTPIAKKISENVLTLPLYPDLSLEDIDKICDIILGK